MFRPLQQSPPLETQTSFVDWTSFGGQPRDRWGTAWILSLIGHTLLLIVLGVSLRPTTKGLNIDSSAARSAGIVVAQRTEQTEYFDEAVEPSPTQPNAATELSQALPASTPSSALEVASPQSPTSSLPLPGSASASDWTAPINGPPRGFGIDSEAEAAMIAADQKAIAARNRNRQGPTAQLSLFGSAAAIGHRFVFVIDRSKSMGGEGLGALAASQSELSHQLQQLKENHEFQIVAYHHRTTMLGQRKMHPATTKYIEMVPEFFGSLGAFGSTDHEMALQTALALDPDVVFFLTDGDQPELTNRQISEIQRRTRGRVTIHCIRFGYGQEQRGDHFMKRLADQTGGDFRYVDMSVGR